MIEFHPSTTSESSRERTRAARLIDRDANDCAISPPPESLEIQQMKLMNAVTTQYTLLGAQEKEMVINEETVLKRNLTPRY